MNNLKHIIRENINEKYCDLIKSRLDLIYKFQEIGRNPTFYREVYVKDSGGGYWYPKIFIVATKTYYHAVILDMIKVLDDTYGISEDESEDCIKNYVDSKINKNYIMLGFENDNETFDFDDDDE